MLSEQAIWDLPIPKLKTDQSDLPKLIAAPSDDRRRSKTAQGPSGITQKSIVGLCSYIDQDV